MRTAVAFKKRKLGNGKFHGHILNKLGFVFIEKIIKERYNIATNLKRGLKLLLCYIIIPVDMFLPIESQTLLISYITRELYVLMCI